VRKAHHVANTRLFVPEPVPSFHVRLARVPLRGARLDLDLKLEPGAALSLNGQQSNRFEFGGAATLKGLVGFEVATSTSRPA